jgi:hypothetical protein
MKRAEKMLHSFRLLYRAAAGALNRQRCAVAPLRGGGGGGCGGGGTFAAIKRRCIPIIGNWRDEFGVGYVTR